MANYLSLESWASRLGYIVERTDCGWAWHAFDEPATETCAGAREVVEKILDRIRSEYGGEE